MRRSYKRKKVIRKKRLNYSRRRYPLYRFKTSKSRYNNQYICLKLQNNLSFGRYVENTGLTTNYYLVYHTVTWFDITRTQEFTQYYNTFTSFTPKRVTVSWVPNSAFKNSNEIIYNYTQLGSDNQRSVRFNAFDGLSIASYDPLVSNVQSDQSYSVLAQNHYFKPWSVYNRTKRKFYPRLTQVSTNRRQSFSEWSNTDWRIAHVNDVNGNLGEYTHMCRFTFIEAQSSTPTVLDPNLSSVLEQIGHFWVYFFIKVHDRR